jgi:hypothetical protein
MSIVLQGSTSGSITLQEPAVAGSNTINLPAATGTAVLTGVSGTVDINAAGSNNVTLSTNSTERMRIDSSGNVGIGTSSPSQKLVVQDSSTTGTAVNIINTSSGGYSWNIFSGGSAASLGPVGSLIFRDSTIGVTRALITSGGNLLVGTTGSTPGYGNTDTGVSIVSTNPSCFSIARTDFVQVLNNNTSDAGTFYLINFRTNNGNRGSITSNGTGVTYGTMSDYRLKENVAPMTGALDKVALLKPVTYKWKENGSDGQGFIAHELQAVVPECVVGEKDAVDEEGNIKPQGVDTSFLVATLTAAIQEQQAQIEELKAKVSALEGVA